MTACSRTKSPTKVADWSKDWTAPLNGDAISTSAWTVDGPDDLLSIVTHTNSTSSATVWLSGGTEGVQYRVINVIETTGGRTYDTVLLMEIIKD